MQFSKASIWYSDNRKVYKGVTPITIMSRKEMFKTEINKIELDTRDNRFYVLEKEENDWIGLKDFPTFSEAEDFLTKRINKKVKGTFKKKEPLKAICKSSGYGSDEKYHHAKITSIDPSEYSTSCWISYGENFKYRRKDSPPLKDTPKNWETLNKIAEIEKELESQGRLLQRYDKEELKEYFQDQ